MRGRAQDSEQQIRNKLSKSFSREEVEDVFYLLDRNGIDGFSAFLEFADLKYYNSSESLVDEFEQSYEGRFSSFENFVENKMREEDNNLKDLDMLLDYILDSEMIARELDIDEESLANEFERDESLVDRFMKFKYVGGTLFNDLSANYYEVNSHYFRVNY
jgi:hypothetical protein